MTQEKYHFPDLKPGGWRSRDKRCDLPARRIYYRAQSDGKTKWVMLPLFFCESCKEIIKEESVSVY